METGLDAMGKWRDMFTENMFFSVYSNPLVQALMGQRATDGPPRRRPGEDPEHVAFVERRIEELKSRIEQGGLREAAIRALVYVRIPENSADERGLEMLRKIRAEHGSKTTLQEFKQIIRDQYLMLKLDERRAVQAIPKLIKGHEAEAGHLLEHLKEVATAGGPLNKESQKRLAEVEQLFGSSTLVEVKPPVHFSKPLAQGVEFEAPKQKSKPKPSTN